MNKNILITGGAGFIGSNLALKLVANGYNVTVLDNLSNQVHGVDPITTSSLYRSIVNKVNFIKGSVNSLDDLKKAVLNQHVIVHLAAETGTGQSMYQVDHYVTVNIGGTSLLLDLLANSKNSVKKLIIASSRSIYGEGKYWCEELGYVYPDHRLISDMENGDFEVKYHKCNNPIKLVATDENSKIHPSSIYGVTKQNQEQMAMIVCSGVGISAVVLRYQNVYGPGQSLKNPYTGILSIFSTLMKMEQEINIFEDGKESRDFVFIDDVVDATLLAIESEYANNEIFNVGTGIATDVLTVVDELSISYGKKANYRISGNFRLGDIRHNYADISKITSKLGFDPKVFFSEGIKLFANWVNTQGITANNYLGAIKEMKDKGLLK